MSEDWLVTTDRSVQLTELLQALQPWGDTLTLRASADESCTLIIDSADHAVAWITPSVPVTDLADIARDHELPGLNAERTWWTEVVVPAGRHGAQDTPSTRGLARAIAHAAGGEALPLSTTTGAQRSACVHGGQPVDDVACDVLTDSSAIFLQTRPILAMTGWVTYAMSWAADRGLRAVFVTPNTARLSPVLRHFAGRGGCGWIQQGSDGMTDGFDGAPLVWDGQAFQPTGPAAHAPASNGPWELLLECEAYHPQASSAPIAHLVSAAQAAVGLATPDTWGLLEPTDRPWDRQVIADQAASTSPNLFRFFTRSADAHGICTVVPKPIGVREDVVVVAGAAGVAELLAGGIDQQRMGERLLQAGCDWSVLGYRPAASANGEPGGLAAEPLPGLIAYRSGRFADLHDLTALDNLGVTSTSGVHAAKTDVGVVITFEAVRARRDEDRTRLREVWRRVLQALAGSGANQPESRPAKPQSVPESVEA
ncbi:MAG: DUF6177 family protein [Ornithinimicrobium sp.]